VTGKRKQRLEAENLNFIPPEDISLQALRDCTLCPRECHADRFAGPYGYCQTGVGFNIGAICIHKGEEPVLVGRTGICNVFFSHCNLQCRYCQNYQISFNTVSGFPALTSCDKRNNLDYICNAGKQRNKSDDFLSSGSKFPSFRGGDFNAIFSPALVMTLEETVGRIESILAQGVSCVGFVSPSHMLLQMKLIIERLRQKGYSPVFVMHTNAYDKVEQLAALEGYIDVFLPDFKYADTPLAADYSDAAEYPAIAKAALKEMFRQKGVEIKLNKAGIIQKGLIIRHLVLPGQLENTKKCLRFIAEELSPQVHISLMAQYTPTPVVETEPELNRTLTVEEYETVLAQMEELGLEQGWIQTLNSAYHYQPDFTQKKIFADQ